MPTFDEKDKILHRLLGLFSWENSPNPIGCTYHRVQKNKRFKRLDTILRKIRSLYYIMIFFSIVCLSTESILFCYIRCEMRYRYSLVALFIIIERRKSNEKFELFREHFFFKHNDDLCGPIVLRRVAVRKKTCQMRRFFGIFVGTRRTRMCIYPIVISI